MSDPKRIDLQLDPDLHPRVTLQFAQLEDVRADLKTLAERWEDFELDEPVVPGFLNPGALLLHIAEAEHWWVRVVLAGQGEGEQGGSLPEEALFPFAIDEEGNAVAGEKPLSDYLVVLEVTRNWTRDFLVGLDADDLGKEYAFTATDGGEYVFTLEWVLHHLVEHEAHHRGQLALLRRLSDTLSNLPAEE